MKNILTIKGIEEICDNYDTFILDQWGVMHDGKKGYDRAIKCVEKLFIKNKNLVIISNSSKRKSSTLDRLPKLGFNPKYFHEVMTSGEMIWQSLCKENYNETKNLGLNCFHIFDRLKEDGTNFFKGLEKFKLVERIEESDFILGSTPFVNSEVIDYIPILDVAIQNKIPFLCANPDFVSVEVSKNSQNIFCMGTVAELYKNMGGKVFFLGKPNIDIYTSSIEKIDNFKKSRVLAIGDSLHHDIKGARNFGIDSVLITSTGIHSKLFDKNNLIWDDNRSSFTNINIKPSFICSEFTF